MNKFLKLSLICVVGSVAHVQAQTKTKTKAKAKAKAAQVVEEVEATAEEAPKKKKVGGLAGQTGGAYGTAGCGLGSIVFGDSPGMIQVLSATTNAWAGTQTFGISTGTSNCTNSSSVAKATEIFIDTNKEVIKKEIAMGSGENLDTLSKLLGCQNSSQLGLGLQKNFDHLFQSDSSREVHMRIERTIKSDEQLSQNCERLG